MSNTAIRTHTERLEGVIEQGVALRDEMRKKIANLERVIAVQKNEILNARSAKWVYQKRLTNYRRKLASERENRQKLEGQLIKLKRRIGDA